MLPILLRCGYSLLDEVERLSGGECIGRYTENTPAESGGGVVLLHISKEALGASVSPLRPHATFHLDSYLMLGDSVVKTPPPHGVKPKLTNTFCLEVASAKEDE